MRLSCLTPGLAIVIPAQAGIQCTLPTFLDCRLRGNDSGGVAGALGFHVLGMAHGAMDS
ncbi:MAG: hypothetical protein JSR53_04740 [Proteobacteria bacterium]|nr:hypothetical protein [Pseudomonadota bacterium]